MDEEQVALQLQAIREQAITIGQACKALLRQVEAILGKPTAETQQPPKPAYMGENNAE